MQMLILANDLNMMDVCGGDQKFLGFFLNVFELFGTFWNVLELHNSRGTCVNSIPVE